MKISVVFNKIICAVMAVVMLSASLIMTVCASDAEQSQIVRVGYMLHDNYQEGEPGEIKSGYGYE